MAMSASCYQTEYEKHKVVSLFIIFGLANPLLEFLPILMEEIAGATRLRNYRLNCQ